MLSGLWMLPLAGCGAWATVGRNPSSVETRGPAALQAQRHFRPFQPVNPGAADVMLTSAAFFLKIPFLFCLKFQKMYLTFKNS
jgi:hypothetical protein